MASARPMPAEVIQYVPCAIGDDGAEARQRAKVIVGRMLTAYWRDGHASAATQSALLNYNDVDPEEFKRMLQRLGSGEPATKVIDDVLLLRYAVAGTASECLEQCREYGDAGVTELAIWFAGDQPGAEIALFGRVFARVR